MRFTVSQIAEMAYELNRAYNDVIANTWFDPPWNGIPPWYRNSIVNGVEGVLAGLPPRQLHHRWRVYYSRMGWRWGEAKDPVARTHPNMVDWDVLPPEQRFKDILFREQVLMLARVGDEMA